MGKNLIKTDAAQDQHHPWCNFSAQPREGCQHCEFLSTAYPVEPGETAAEATARYFPAETPPLPAPAAPDLVMVKRGRPILEATEEMVEAHVQVQEALHEIDILLQQRTVTVRRERPKTASEEARAARKKAEAERVEGMREAKIVSARTRTRRIILETDGHKREVKAVKTTANALEKSGRLPRDLAKHLYVFAQRVADGMGAATEDEHDSTNRLTASYDIVATSGGFGSRTPSDRQLIGLAASQEMRKRIPAELMPIYDQILDEEVCGYSSLGRTLSELGEALGYKHKQTTAAGGALVYAVTCLIAHYMRTGRLAERVT